MFGKRSEELNIKNCLILIIDIQEKLKAAVFNSDSVTNRARILSKAAEILNLPVIITEQYPKGLGNTIPEIKENLNTENIKIFEKKSFNALIEPEIKKSIKNCGRKNIVVCGIETHICVYQTAMALVNAGYNVTLAADVCGSRSEYEHNMAIDNMRTENVKIKTTEMILFEFLKAATHHKFKEIQNLIK